MRSFSKFAVIFLIGVTIGIAAGKDYEKRVWRADWTADSVNRSMKGDRQ